MDCGVACDLATQCSKKDLQALSKYWKKKRSTDHYIALCGPTHCALVAIVSKTWRVSDATCDRNFNLSIVPTAKYLGLKVTSTKHYLTEKVNFFTLGVIPTDVHLRQFQAIKDEMTREMVRLWES